MNILTFDTSLDKTYITLSKEGEIVSDVVIENHDEKYHSAYLIPAIVDILKKNKIVMQDINAIGTNIGPGSFTGIRACVTVARVIAQQLECPLVGVSSLEILSKINEQNTKTVVVLDARKNQYYVAVYEEGKELSAPKLVNADDVKQMCFDSVFVVSDASSAKFLEEMNIKANVYTDLNKDLGVYLNNIVMEKIQNIDSFEFQWGKLKPLYLQMPSITVSSKK